MSMRVFQVTPDDVTWCTEPEKYLTLNAEEVLSCMHGQTLLVAGWRQCCYVTKDTRHRNATEYQEYISKNAALDIRVTCHIWKQNYLCSFLRLFSSSWRTFLSCKKSWCFSSWRPWSFSPIFITWSVEIGIIALETTLPYVLHYFVCPNPRYDSKAALILYNITFQLVYVFITFPTCSLVSSRDILSSISFVLFLSSSSFIFCSIILSTSSSSGKLYSCY